MKARNRLPEPSFYPKKLVQYVLLYSDNVCPFLYRQLVNKSWIKAIFKVYHSPRSKNGL